MTKLLLSGFLLVFGAQSYAHAQAIPHATVAELALHRVEKLVTLNKIAPEYQTNFKQINIEVLNPAKPTDPVYKTTILQNPGSDKMSDMVIIMQDSTGKAVSNKAMVHTNSPKLIVWPQKDPVTLAELALHYLEDDYTSNDNSKELFVENISELVITQETDSAGKMIAILTMKNSFNAGILTFKYTADGKFISSEFKL